MSLPFNISTAFNLQSNRNGIIVFVELLRKNPKIFEPLKRLTSAVTSYFQNYTAPHNTFCRFGFAATGGLRNARSRSTSQAKCVNPSGARPRGSQERRSCRQGC